MIVKVVGVTLNPPAEPLIFVILSPSTSVFWGTTAWKLPVPLVAPAAMVTVKEYPGPSVILTSVALVRVPLPSGNDAVTVTVALVPSGRDVGLRLRAIVLGTGSLSLIASAAFVKENPPAVPETVTVSPGSATVSSVTANWKVPVPLIAPAAMVIVRSGDRVIVRPFGGRICAGPHRDRHHGCIRPA